MVFSPSGSSAVKGNLSKTGGQKKFNTSMNFDKNSRYVPPGAPSDVIPAPNVSRSPKFLDAGVEEFPARRHSMPKMEVLSKSTHPEVPRRSCRSPSVSWKSASASSLPAAQAAGKRRRYPAKKLIVRIPSPVAKVSTTPRRIVRKATPPPLLGKLPVSPVKITISPESPETPPPMSPGQFRRYELRRLMDIFIHAATSTHCSCASNLKMVEAQCGDDPEVEVSWDDLERRCTDFGISDYLSTSLDLGGFCGPEMMDESLELIPDFDSGESFHWLSATPPQRFSDPDLDIIEPLPVTLDTILNLQVKESDEAIEGQVESEVFENGSREDDLSFLNLDNFRRPSKLSWSASKDESGNGTRAPIRHCPRRLSRQISLPSSLFTDLYMKSREKGPLAINFRLNRQESLSESFKTRLLHQLESLSIGSSEGLCMDSPESMSSSWETPLLPARNEGDLQVKGSFDLDSVPPFSSDLEKRAILVRNMRRLIRQDTIGNFAPPDFCI